MFRRYFIKRRLERENYKINKRRRNNEQIYYTVSFKEIIVGFCEFINDPHCHYEKPKEFGTKEDAKNFIEHQILINHKRL